MNSNTHSNKDITTDRHLRGQFGYSQQSTRPHVRRNIYIGLIILAVMVFGFGGWAVFTPLEAAAVAEGRLTVQNQVKTIQHLEGGIIKTIHVKEGQWVKKDEPLVTLDDTQASARLSLLQVQANELIAEQARLLAQRDEKNNIEFPNDLFKRAPFADLKHIIQGQINIFQSNKENLRTTIEILEKRISQSEDEIQSFRSQINSANEQLKFLEEELEALRYLDKKGLIEKPRLLALEREKARLEGERGERTALIAQTEQKIGETRIQILNVREKDRNDTLTQLRDTQRELADVLERERAAQDIMDRIVIRAPIDGRVVDLKVHTLSGVIGPRDPLLTIVPEQEQLMIEARVSPLDIDVLHNGLKAKVQLSAYKQRHVPTLEGTVTNVSADSFSDQKSGMTYYIVYVTIDKGQEHLLENIKLYQGMPAQVMIITDKRTMMDYIIVPIKESLTRAFRED